MAKPAERILRSDAGQRLDDHVLQRLTCACPDPSQDGLQFGKGTLNWGEIGRVHWEKQDLAASRFNSLFDPPTGCATS
jgi:hypothetical protein